MLRRFHLHAPPKNASLTLTLNFIRHVQSTKFTSNSTITPPITGCQQQEFVSMGKAFENNRFTTQNNNNNTVTRAVDNLHFNDSINCEMRRTQQLAENMRAILPKYSSTLPIEEMRNKIKESKGIELEEYFAQWFLQNENADAFRFLFLFPGTCRADTSSWPRVRALFQDLAAATSEALRLGSLPYFLRRNGKTLIDSAFGRVFTTQANVDKCQKRHLGEFPIQLGFWRNADRFLKFIPNWRDDTSSDVLILHGSSGVGKTCAALDFARTAFHAGFGSTTFVAYINLSQGVKYSRIDTKNAWQRNKDVEEVIMESFAEAILGDLAGAPFSSTTLSHRLVPWNDPDAEKSHFVVVVDECGLSHNFLRGLVETASDFCERLHNILFSDKADIRTNPPRVNFIAAGSDANYSVVAARGLFTPHRFCYNLDSAGARVDPLDSLLRLNKCGFSDATKSNLLRLSKSFARNRDVGVDQQPANAEEPLSAEEEQAADLCTNFRAAACLLHEFDSYSKSVAALNIEGQNELHKFRQTLRHILKPAVSNFCSMNHALSLFERPLEVLACAVAVDLLRLPFVPAASIEHIAGLKRIAKAPDMDLHQALCSFCGVVFDGARKEMSLYGTIFFELESSELHTEPNRSWTRFFSIENIVPQRGEPLPDAQDGKLVINDSNERFNRFQCSRAIRAMFRIAMGIAPSSSWHWSAAEQRFADLCMLLAPLSNIVETLYADINDEFRTKNIPYYDTQTKQIESPLTMRKYLDLLDDLPRFHDPLTRLKQLLVFEGKFVSAAEKIQLRSSPLKYINRVLYNWKTSVDIYTSAKNKALEIYDLVSEKVKNGIVTVLVSPPMEQFADGIVIGPGKVILFQCKSLIGSESEKEGNFKISWHDELAKMGVLDQQKTVKADKLRELWLFTLIAAASSMTNEKEFKQKLDKFNFDDSTPSMFTGMNNLDVSLHVVFFADCGRQRALQLMTDFKKNVKFNNNNSAQPTQNYVRESLKTDSMAANHAERIPTISNFRRDLRFCSIDFVTVQRKDKFFDGDCYATSDDVAPMPASTPFAPLMEREVSCTLFKNAKK